MSNQHFNAVAGLKWSYYFYLVNVNKYSEVKVQHLKI